jgi:hypothetical protein
MSNEIIPGDQVVQSIRFICSQKVLLDSDLAGFYGIAAKVLNHAVKRNRVRTHA